MVSLILSRKILKRREVGICAVSKSGGLRAIAISKYVDASSIKWHLPATKDTGCSTYDSLLGRIWQATAASALLGGNRQTYSHKGMTTKSSLLRMVMGRRDGDG
jgi:hypothetical protein